MNKHKTDISSVFLLVLLAFYALYIDFYSNQLQSYITYPLIPSQTDTPFCKSVQRVHYGVAKHEEARIDCEVDADPNEVVFHWNFNSTNTDNEDQVKFVSSGMKSTATYTPRHELDYGRLYCWAVNSAGKQREPCVFFVIEAGN